MKDENQIKINMKEVEKKFNLNFDEIEKDTNKEFIENIIDELRFVGSLEIIRNIVYKNNVFPRIYIQENSTKSVVIIQCIEFAFGAKEIRTDHINKLDLEVLNSEFKFD